MGLCANVLLLLLSRFCRVRLCATPEMAGHQAPLSLAFSRQEHWSGLPFPLQCMKVKNESEVAQLCPTLCSFINPRNACPVSQYLLPCPMCLVTQSCLTLCNPMDCSAPGSSVHGILQARILELDAMPSFRGSSRPRD